MRQYGNINAIGLDLGSKLVNPSAKKFVVENNYSKYGDGGEFGGGGRLNKNDEYVKIEKEMNVLEGKRAKWIGSSEARSILNSPYDEEIAELQKKLDLIEGEAVKKYDIPSVRGMDEKAQKKMAFEFYLLLQKPKSLSKFLNSLTTPLRKKTWDKLQYKSYQNKWGYKVIINKSADTIRVDKKYADGGEFSGGGSVTKKLKRVVAKGTKYGNLAIKKAKPKAKKIVRKLKIGFNALANKVAKSYEGKAVAPKYQKEYGKRYSKEEAKEVGNKVAAKVKRMKGM
jgi:hypothetical protein